MLDIKNISGLADLSVLYVEDDSETREELELVLKNSFSQLYIATNGREGLALYEKNRPDIVISDIQMPLMNGLSMSADIKLIQPDQEIIILTAYNDVEYLFRALELGIKHYITKPISIKRLLEKLKEISQQIQLQNEVKRNRKLLQQYKSLVDEKAIVTKINLQGKICYVNPQYRALSGYSEEELIGQDYLFTFEKDQQKEILEDLKKTVLDEKKWQGILKKTHKCGDIYIVDVTVMPILDENDQIEEFVALMLDITEVYEKFERLSLNLQQSLNTKQHFLKEYKRAIELGTSLCVLDPDGIILSTNKNFCKTLNCQADELIGQSFSDIVIDCGDFKQQILSKVQSQGYHSKVIRISAKPNRECTLSTVIVGIHNEAGTLHSLMSLSQDISDSVKLSKEIIDTQKELIYVMGEVVENRSPETGLHIKRVAQISQLLAEKYGLSTDHAQMIKIASPMHDIGKIGTPDAILHKPGKLTNQEFQTMKKHTDIGFKILNKLDRPLIKMAATIAHEHHEHFNGEGYPLGLSGEQISIEARIVSLVDVFDALSSKRSYKKAWSDEQIIDYFLASKGLQFDPKLVDLFIDNLDQIMAIRNQLHDKNNHA